MSLGEPLALLLLLLIPLLVLLHRRLERRRTVSVSSLLIWQRVLDGRLRHARLRGLLADLLLALQIAAVAALALALAGPRVPLGGGAAGGSLVLVVDTSASMKAADAGGTRFDEARSRALLALRELPRGASVMLIAAAARPEVMLPYTESRALAAAAVRRLQATDEPGDPRAALLAAAGFAGGRPRSRILFVTDGAFDPPAEASRSAIRLDVSLVGSAADNTAITAFRYRRAEGGGGQFLVRVRRFGTTPAATRLSVSLDRRLLAAEPLVLAPGGESTFIVPWNGPEAGVAVAELEGTDALAADNRAYALLSAADLEVLLVSRRSDPFLERALAVIPGVHVRRATGPPAPARGEGDPPPDVVIYEGEAPAERQPGRYLFIDALPPGSPLARGGRLERLTVGSWNREHPVMRGIEPEGASIGETRATEAPPWLDPLFAARQGPLAFALAEPDRRWIYLGFALGETDLVERPAFPLFIANSLAWLAASPDGHGRSGAPLQNEVQAGSPIALVAARGAVVERPDGSLDRPAAAGAGAGPGYYATSLVGVYRVRPGDRRFAVNLESPAESDLAPRSQPARRAAVLGGEPASSELWRLAALMALAAVLAEWIVQGRRW